MSPAERDQGDPDNALVRLGFDPALGRTDGERLSAALAKLYGSDDAIIGVKADDAELAAARDRARLKLPGLRTAVGHGLAAGESVLVKSPFKTAGGGGEYMWVEVTKWDGPTISGILQSDPDQVPDLKAGSTVTVVEADVFDYIHRSADGSTDGNETGRILGRRAAAGDAPRRR